MEVHQFKIADVQFADYNPRKLTNDQFEHLKKSLDRFGFVDPVIINRHPERMNVLVGGHQRTRTWEKMGNSTVPAVFVELDIEKEKELNVRLNKNTGEWDFDMLANYFETDDLIDWGFSEEELFGNEEELEPEETTGDDDIPDAPEEPRTKLGDVYVLGDHRLMCGDSTSIDAIEALMDGQEADLVVTDPPYNVAVNDESEESLKKRNRRTDGLKIENDNMSEADFEDFLYNVFVSYYSLIREGGGIYVFYADSMTIPFMTKFIEAGFHFAQNCIWNKQQFVMTRKDYHYKHEPILYGWKKGKAHEWHTDRKQSSVWDFDRPFKNELHPTMKPIDLISYPVNNSSRRGDIIVDLFGGSGSTLISCEKNRRKCRTMELDPKYCDVIVKRYVDFCQTNGKEWSVELNGEDISNDFNNS